MDWLFILWSDNERRYFEESTDHVWLVLGGQPEPDIVKLVSWLSVHRRQSDTCRTHYLVGGPRVPCTCFEFYLGGFQFVLVQPNAIECKRLVPNDRVLKLDWIGLLDLPAACYLDVRSDACIRGALEFSDFEDRALDNVVFFLNRFHIYYSILSNLNN